MKHLSRYLLAILIITFGILLILENLGIVSLNLKTIWIYTYPMIFILFGLKWMIERLRGINGSLVLGSFFFIFGSLLMLDRFNIIHFTFKDIYKLWPLVIVYIGLAFIFQTQYKGKNIKFKNQRDKHYEKSASNFNSDDKKQQKNSSMFSVGDYEFKEMNWKVEPMYLSNMAGDFHLDFTKAYIPNEEIPIVIKAWAGDIHILIPEEVEFRIYCKVRAGDIKVDAKTASGVNRQLLYETDGFEQVEQKLDFQLRLTFGNIHVDRV